MMTLEEIKKTAREYVKEVYSGDTDFIDEAENIIQWLSEKYCIVPKNEVKKYYEDVCEDIEDYDGKGVMGISCANITMYQRARGMKQMLYRLFGKELFNEERK